MGEVKAPSFPPPHSEAEKPTRAHLLLAFGTDIRRLRGRARRVVLPYGAQARPQSTPLGSVLEQAPLPNRAVLFQETSEAKARSGILKSGEPASACCIRAALVRHLAILVPGHGNEARGLVSTAASEDARKPKQTHVFETQTNNRACRREGSQLTESRETFKLVHEPRRLKSVSRCSA